jgi:hypothetical protein
MVHVHSRDLERFSFVCSLYPFVEIRFLADQGISGWVIRKGVSALVPEFPKLMEVLPHCGSTGQNPDMHPHYPSYLTFGTTRM